VSEGGGCGLGPASDVILNLVHGKVAGALLVGMLMAGTCAFALSPALDVSQYAHTAWKIRDGFAKGSILSIAQTPDGYLWLGTAFGLYRFDGVRNVLWQPPPDQQLPSTTISTLVAARDGALWIGTWSGLVSWKNGKLTQYAELAGLHIFALVEDDEGSIWAGTSGPSDGKLCEIRNGGVRCHAEMGGVGRGVFGLHKDGKGNLWVELETGVWRWRPGPPQFYAVPGLLNGRRDGMQDGEDGALLIATTGGVMRLADGKAEAVYRFPTARRGFRRLEMLRDREGGLWVCPAGRGIVHIHQGRTDVFSESDGLSGDDIYDLFEDREGNIWVATINGLDRFRELPVVTYSRKQGLSDIPWGGILAAKDGSVWFATLNGLNRLSHGQVAVYRQHRTVRGQEVVGSGLPDEGVGSLFQDSRGRIWISTLMGIGYLETDRFVPTSAPGGLVGSITMDASGDLWIANRDLGLLRLPQDNVFPPIPWATFGRKDPAVVLAADPLHGGLWLGFSRGGIVWFRDGHIGSSYSATDGLGEGPINQLRFDSEGALWIATEGGLTRLKDGHIATLTSKNALPCDAVQWTMEDDAQSVWLMMPCGLVRVARSELDTWASAPNRTNRTIHTTVFDNSDGIRSLAVVGDYTPRVAKSGDGELWFISPDGISVVDPHRIPINKLPPPVHIENVAADRKEYMENVSDNAPTNLRLPPLVRELEIDYTALSLVAPDKVLFRYKLEGWDQDWQDAGTRRQAFYGNLPPRNYTFRVKACNNSGLWNEADTSLDFSVAPAYYQTTWFRLSGVAAFFALLVGVYHLRLMQLAREFNVRVEERVRERTRIARELHDSLLQSFQGLMFRLQAVRDLPPERSSEVIEALDIALERGDRAIAEGRDTVSDLRESIVGDKDVAEALTALGEELAAQSDNGTAPFVRVLVEGKPRELDPLLRDEIYRIAREALRNAFRHAKAQKIEAEITYGHSEFLLHVRDDGSGIAPQVANRGSRAGHWGIPGMRERAKSFGGTLELWSQRGAGTEIKLTVPASVAYGRSKAHRRFSFLRKKIGETDELQP
jgi:signal transduction histidine kinase/ligand-binding sensor domain-containing protein